MTSDLVQSPHSIEAEQSVIGGILIDATTDNAQQVLSSLKADSFYNKANQLIFAEMQEMNTKQQIIDMLTLSESLDGKSLLDKIGGFAYIAEVAKNTPSAANIRAYAGVVRDRAMARYSIAKTNEITELLYANNGMSSVDKIEAAQTLFAQITDHAKTGKKSGLKALPDVMESWLDEVEQRFSSTRPRGLSTGVQSLDELFYPKGIVKGSLFVIGARPKMGKAQPLSSKILLADGSWTTFGSVKIGDNLASIDGRESFVKGVFPQGERDIYRVTFSDGRFVDCADDHLWEVNSSKFTSGSRVLSTIDLKVLIEKERYKNRISVPSISGEYGKHINLGINPWVLGMLLGDGGLTSSVRFSTSEDYIVERTKRELGADFNVKHIDCYDYSINHEHTKQLSLKCALKELGVWGKGSPEKFIPKEVFSADFNTRALVLCGLIETDGWVEGSNALRFSSSSKALADDVAKLVHSLGGVCRRSVKKVVKYKYNNQIKKGLPAHLCSIRLGKNVTSLFESPRIINGFKSKIVKTTSPVIISIEHVGTEECTCIMVSHESHLYATDGYIMTHNTTILSDFAINCAMKEKLPTVIFSLEMPQEQIFERMVGQYTRVNTDIFYRGADNDSDFARANAGALELATSGNLFIDDTPAITLGHIVAESRRIKRDKGVIGMIMIDYLTLMKPEKAERNDLAYGLVTKGLKNLAKELDCVVVLLTQLNRGNEQRGNKRPLPSDSRDTGQIEQDCDYWLGIHREGATDEKADQHLTELLLRLNRHGKTGIVYIEQKNGIIYDLDQATAEMRAKKHEEKQKRYAKEGGF